MTVEEGRAYTRGGVDVIGREYDGAGYSVAVDV